jgi:solute carrier family 39 (zinc transporter), member 1/2/3
MLQSHSLLYCLTCALQADAVLVAMAAGTFVYVGATEVVADEFESPHHKWKKFGALLGGVVLIGYITHVAESFEHAAHHH